MREIVLDTETTGLNYKSGDRVVEVGCVELVNHVATKNTLQFYCSVEKHMHPDATRITGLTNEFLSNHPPFIENVNLFLDFIKDDNLIIHNADFDMGFINNELHILGKEGLKNKVVDTVILARKNLNTRIANLDYLCRRFAIDLTERKLHGALLDSHLLAEVYLELIGGKQISMNLEKSIQIKSLTESGLNAKRPPPTKVNLSEKELTVHKKSIKGIKNSLWEKIDY